jgi:hypothetical protein
MQFPSQPGPPGSIRCRSQAPPFPTPRPRHNLCDGPEAWRTRPRYAPTRTTRSRSPQPIAAWQRRGADRRRSPWPETPRYRRTVSSCPVEIPIVIRRHIVRTGIVPWLPREKGRLPFRITPRRGGQSTADQLAQGNAAFPSLSLGTPMQLRRQQNGGPMHMAHYITAFIYRKRLVATRGAEFRRPAGRRAVRLGESRADSDILTSAYAPLHRGENRRVRFRATHPTFRPTLPIMQALTTARELCPLEVRCSMLGVGRSDILSAAASQVFPPGKDV